MINAGAILVCSLMKTLVNPDMTLAEKFDYTQQWLMVSEVPNWRWVSFQVYFGIRGQVDRSLYNQQYDFRNKTK